VDTFLGLEAEWWAIIVLAVLTVAGWFVITLSRKRGGTDDKDSQWKALLSKALDKIPTTLEPNNPPPVPEDFDELKQELNEQLKRGVSTSVLDLLKVGAVEYARENYDKAMHYFQIALDKAEKANDKTFMSAAIGNIGLVHLAEHDFDSALQFLQKALDLGRQTGFVIGQASDLGSLGLIYLKKEEHDKALQCLSESLGLYKTIGDQQGQATQLASIGLVYLARNNYTKAIENLREALDIHRKTGYGRGEAQTLRNIGFVYEEKGDFENALQYFREALLVVERHGVIDERDAISNAIYKIEQQLKKPQAK